MTEREFRERVLSLQRLMYGMALKMGIPPDDAADVVQDTQIRLWQRRDAIPIPGRELKLYCLAAFRNECVSRVRREKALLTLDEADDPVEPPGEDTEYRDTRHNIERLIDSLPAGQRKAIRLSGFGGFDNAEIAGMTGQTENNVRQLLSRGRRRLRELMEGFM